jgi:hypothetical protein
MTRTSLILVAVKKIRHIRADVCHWSLGLFASHTSRQQWNEQMFAVEMPNPQIESHYKNGKLRIVDEGRKCASIVLVSYDPVSLLPAR